MDKKKRAPNIDALLQKLEDFLDEIPSGADDEVNWEELAERKETAQRALDLLTETVKETTGT